MQKFCMPKTPQDKSPRELCIVLNCPETLNYRLYNLKTLYFGIFETLVSYLPVIHLFLDIPVLPYFHSIKNAIVHRCSSLIQPKAQAKS